jgi:hypothetical protein
MKEVEIFDSPDLSLLSARRRRTRTVAPITRRTAATPPKTAPAIAPVCDDAADCSLALPAPVVVTLAFIVKTGALKERGLSNIKQSKRSPCTNFRANGANIAPWAGLIMVMAMLITTLDT